MWKISSTLTKIINAIITNKLVLYENENWQKTLKYLNVARYLNSNKSINKSFSSIIKIK